MATHHSAGLNPAATAAAAAGGVKPEGKIRTAHLLVKHKDSRRPSSWKQDSITRSKEDALGLLKGYEERIRKGEVSISELAKTESDCSSARKGGDL